MKRNDFLKESGKQLICLEMNLTSFTVTVCGGHIVSIRAFASALYETLTA